LTRRCLPQIAGVAIDGGDPEVALATVELARLLRRCGRIAEAGVAWSRLVTAPGPLAGLGWIEVAKEREHRERDLAGAWAARIKPCWRSTGAAATATRCSGGPWRRISSSAVPAWPDGSSERLSGGPS